MFVTNYKELVIDELARAKKDFEDDNFKIINKYEADFDSETATKRPYKRCLITELTCVIAADSKVYFCHDNAYKEEFCIGDLKDKSFSDIWFSDEVVNRYLHFDPTFACGAHCVYDERNILLNSLYEIDKKHINFI